MRLNTFYLALASGVWLASISPAWGRPLSLDEYLAQVRQRNPEVRAAAATIESTRLREQSAEMIFTPQFFGQVSRQVDEKPPINPITGIKSEVTTFSMGVQKVWNFGLQSQLSYTTNGIDIYRDPVPPPFAMLGNDSSFTEAQLRLELVQPLWKNGLGRDYRVSLESAQAKLVAQRQVEQYKDRVLRTNAEFVYWQLALANEAARTQEGALARFVKIREWVKARVKLQLADQADLLQAEAGVKARRLEVELTRRDRIALARTANNLRGVQGDQIEELQPISGRVLNNAPPMPVGVKRLDVEISKQQEKLSSLEVEAIEEKFKPQLDVFGTLGLNSEQTSSFDQALLGVSMEKPTIIIGLKFSTPLDRDLINKEKSGILKVSEAATADRELKEFKAQQEWDELRRQLADAKVRLQLSTDIEIAQKQKLEYERQRHEKGRTTTYQIILYDQDYANSQLGTIKAKADVLGILAKLKSFGDAT